MLKTKIIKNYKCVVCGDYHPDKKAAKECHPSWVERSECPICHATHDNLALAENCVERCLSNIDAQHPEKAQPCFVSIKQKGYKKRFLALNNKGELIISTYAYEAHVFRSVSEAIVAKKLFLKGNVGPIYRLDFIPAGLS